MLNTVTHQRFARRPLPPVSVSSRACEAPLIMREKGPVYEISADMCGLSQDDVMAHVSGRVLTIMGDDVATMRDDDEIPLALHHVVLLPPDANMARASVRCARGRFILMVPRG